MGTIADRNRDNLNKDKQLKIGEEEETRREINRETGKNRDKDRETMKRK